MKGAFHLLSLVDFSSPCKLLGITIMVCTRRNVMIGMVTVRPIRSRRNADRHIVDFLRGVVLQSHFRADRFTWEHHLLFELSAKGHSTLINAAAARHGDRAGIHSRRSLNPCRVPRPATDDDGTCRADATAPQHTGGRQSTLNAVCQFRPATASSQPGDGRG